jgi:uncharacterized protein (TIGR02145 family)
MNRLFRIIVIPILLIGLTLCLASCKPKPTLAVVTTTNITDKTQTTATSGGNVTSDGNAEVTARGVCWGTSQNPTTGSSMTNDGTGTGNFTSSITGLTPGTTYYVRAYATNSEGTSYGNEVTFSTIPISLATVRTDFVYSITLTMAIVNGYIEDDGGGTITASGVCWSTSQNPTIADNKTTDIDDSSGNILSYLTDLTANTKYYVRAYATSSVGTAYGNQLNFTTASIFSAIVFNPALTYNTISDNDGNTYKTIQIGTQTLMAENLKTTKLNDGTAIPLVTEDQNWTALSTPGYCWYNNETNYTKGYGALYNWYAVTTGKLCPAGWHVPSDNEWTVFVDFLGGMDVANAKIRETGTTHWQSESSDATNISGFTALPGGCRFWTGQFANSGISIYLWSSTEYFQSGGLSLYWDYLNYGIWTSYGSGRGNNSANGGLSVRCLKD